MKNISSVLFAGLLTSSAKSWSINGHLFVANIAQDLLLENSSTTFTSALTMLAHLKEFDPSLTAGEADHPFVECATFADDIKYHGGAWQSDYHFVDNPFIEEGKTTDYTIAISPHNLTYGIESIVQWLSIRNDGTDYLQSYAYQYIQNSLFPGNESLAKSYALRLLIHYIGDIH